jgi:hypothetical protein
MFDPANNLAEGPNTNFLAEGFTTEPDGDWFMVKPAGPTGSGEGMTEEGGGF